MAAEHPTSPEASDQGTPPRPLPRDDRGEDADRTVLVYLGTALIATGQPVSDVEDEVIEVSSALGYPGVQVAASPPV